MSIIFFLQGLAIGFAIAAPVGPIGVLCIQRTLSGGKIYGFVSGLGAATADAIYGFLAAFGLTFISNFVVEQQDWVRLIGGGFLWYLAVRIFLSQPLEQAEVADSSRHVGAFTSTFFLTLTNPMTILSFAAIFAGVGMVSPDASYVTASLLVMGVFLGSGLWWFVLSVVTGIIRKRLSHSKLVWVNRASAIIVGTFGLLALLSVRL